MYWGLPEEQRTERLKKPTESEQKVPSDLYQDASQKEWAEDKFREIQEAYNQIVDERSGKTRGNYGGYGQSNSQNYSEEDQHLMAAMNYIRARRYNEAINVLNAMGNRSARWYYLASYANLGLGNNVVAMDYAKRACEMEPADRISTVLPTTAAGRYGESVWRLWRLSVWWRLWRLRWLWRLWKLWRGKFLWNRKSVL